MLLMFSVFSLGILMGLPLRSKKLVFILERCVLFLGYALTAMMVFLAFSSYGAAWVPWHDIGISLGLALAAIVGSLLMTMMAFLLLPRAGSDDCDAAGETSKRPAKYSNEVLIGNVVAVAFGSMALFLNVARAQRDHVRELVHAGLIAIVLGVGMQIGMQILGLLESGKRSAGSLLMWRAWWPFLVLPTTVIAGSLLGAAAIAPFANLTWKQAALMSAPMGWYSLGGPMILKSSGDYLGSLAFLANLLRDVVALFVIPLLAKTSLPLLALAPGGATTMDMLLPTTVTSVGSRHIALATWVGACCAFWAPILMTVLG